MTIINRARKNIFFKFISEVVSRIFTLVFFIYLARKLGDSDFGIYSYLYSFCMLLIVIIDPGINQILIRNVSREKNNINEHVSSVTLLKIVLVILYFLTVHAVNFATGSKSYPFNLVSYMALVIISLSLFEYLSSIFCSVERMDIEALIKFLSKLLILIFGFLALTVGLGLSKIILSVLTAYLISIVIALYLIRNLVKITSFKFNFEYWKSLLKDALPLAFNSVLLLLVVRVDIILLSLLGRSTSEIGWYSASTRIIDTLGVFPFLIMGGTFPIMADLYKNQRQKFDLFYEKSLKLLFFAGVPTIIITYMLSRHVIILLFGKQYYPSIAALKIQIFQMGFIFVNSLLINALIAMEKQKILFLITAICVPLNIGLNYFLILKFGYLGAAYTSVLTQLCLFAIAGYFAEKNLKSNNLISLVLKFGSVAVIQGVAIYLLRGRPLALALPLTLVLYFVSVYLFKGISYEELVIVKKIVKGT